MLSLALFTVLAFTTISITKSSIKIQKLPHYSEWNGQPLCDAIKQSNNFHDLHEYTMSAWRGEACYGGCINKCYKSWRSRIKKDDIYASCKGNNVKKKSGKYWVKEWKRDESCKFNKNCGFGMTERIGFRAVCEGRLYQKYILPARDVDLQLCHVRNSTLFLDNDYVNQLSSRCRMPWAPFEDAIFQRCPEWYKNDDVWYVQGMEYKHLWGWDDLLINRDPLILINIHSKDASTPQFAKHILPLYMQICTKKKYLEMFKHKKSRLLK